jgi:SAM-dependent methyltransferase
VGCVPGTTTADLAGGWFPDGRFDGVHAHQPPQHLSDPVAALREMRRVCTPGGVVAAQDVDYAAIAWYPEVTWAGPVARALPAAGPGRPGRAERRAPAAGLAAGRVRRGHRRSVEGVGGTDDGWFAVPRSGRSAGLAPSDAHP